jgi:hypothetical protein
VDDATPRAGPLASDAERDWFAAVLQRHFADGRLTEDEFSARMDLVLHARALAELYDVVEDLPGLPAVDVPQYPARRRRRVWRWWLP